MKGKGRNRHETGKGCKGCIKGHKIQTFDKKCFSPLLSLVAQSGRLQDIKPVAVQNVKSVYVQTIQTTTINFSLNVHDKLVGLWADITEYKENLNYS